MGKSGGAGLARQDLYRQIKAGNGCQGYVTVFKGPAHHRPGGKPRFFVSGQTVQAQRERCLRAIGH
jgi:hypothetical protein